MICRTKILPNVQRERFLDHSGSRTGATKFCMQRYNVPDRIEIEFLLIPAVVAVELTFQVPCACRVELVKPDRWITLITLKILSFGLTGKDCDLYFPDFFG